MARIVWPSITIKILYLDFIEINQCNFKQIKYGKKNKISEQEIAFC